MPSHQSNCTGRRCSWRWRNNDGGAGKCIPVDASDCSVKLIKPDGQQVTVQERKHQNGSGEEVGTRLAGLSSSDCVRSNIALKFHDRLEGAAGGWIVMSVRRFQQDADGGAQRRPEARSHSRRRKPPSGKTSAERGAISAGQRS